MCALGKKRCFQVNIFGGMNSKLHVLSEGQRSDLKGADVLLSELPAAQVLIADQSYDSSRVRKLLADQNITSCIPCHKNCKKIYKKRHKVENIFARLKDRGRITMRYDRCTHTFESAIYIATIVLFWIWVLSLAATILADCNAIIICSSLGALWPTTSLLA